MQIETIPIENLRPSPYNPRLISPDEMRKLKKSLTEFGCVDPIIINKSNQIIGGHQRIDAMKELGIKDAPCIRVDLPPAKEKALNIALNKISGEWDMPKLKDLLEEIDTGEFDIEITGWDFEEIENIMTAEQPRLSDYAIIKDPDTAWVLIAAPLTKWQEINAMVAAIERVDGIIVKTVLNRDIEENRQ